MNFYTHIDYNDLIFELIGYLPNGDGVVKLPEENIEHWKGVTYEQTKKFGSINGMTSIIENYYKGKEIPSFAKFSKCKKNNLRSINDLEFLMKQLEKELK